MLEIKKLRLIFPATACILVFGSFFMFSCGKESEEVVTEEIVRPVKMLTIESGKDVLTRKYPGKVEASQKVDLAFQVSGPLTALPVIEGQEVKKGDLLARIDPRDFENDLAVAKSELKNAKAQYERQRKLYEEGVVAKAQLDVIQKNFEVLDGNVRIARKALADTSLLAPFSGRIAKTYVENFQNVKAKELILSLQDISSIEIVVDLPEMIMVTIKEGGERKIFAEFAAAPGKQYPVTVKKFETEADPKTQTYRIVLTMPAPEELNVLPGMTAVVSGSRPEDAGEADQFIIPAAAVFADEAGASHVWVVDQETMGVHRRKVTTGDLTGKGSIQIVEGLQSGEMIAISGVSRLVEGMQVRPME
jgi:RND family efflux transporter MFP subunit